MYISRRSRRGLRWLKDIKFTKENILKFGIIGLIGSAVLGVLFTFILFTWYGRDLPAPGKLSQISENSTVFYDRDGKVLFEMYKDNNRLPVAFNDISNYLKKATIAIEDKNFYTHGGISQVGILRAVFTTLTRGKISGSGSTITQQLIKNVLLDSTQTASRKIKEIILAISVEGKYTKDQILEMYLNEIPYGGSFVGIGSAAKGYFNKAPKDLNILESAILAGLPQSPSYYSPFIGVKDTWKGRTKDVLRRMREDGYITSQQEKDALVQMNKIVFSSSKMSINAPHFVFYVKEQIEKEYGTKILDQGLKIKTTISLDTQTAIEKIVKDEIMKIKDDFNVGNGAAVVLDSQTNEILAMVGSYDFNDPDYGKFNAALGLRQPGSTIKPLTYATAFEKGYTPATMLMDVKTTFPTKGQPDYIPVNYDGKFHGPVQLRLALGNSFNIPAVKLLGMIGIRDFLQKASDMGLATLAPTEENMNRFGLSLTLGGGEVTLVDIASAFSVFARGGVRKDTQSILEIKDHKDQVIFRARPGKETKPISPEVSFLVSHILSDNNAREIEFGLRSYLNVPGKTVAVKTGTTDDKRDNWAIGFTKGITVGVWVGNNDNTKMNPKIASGATGASPIWYQAMLALLKKYPDGIMDKPSKVKALTIDSYFGGLPKDSNPTRSEYFIEGTEPKDISSSYKKLKISKSNGKLANDIEIKSGNFEEKECYVVVENDPNAIDGKNKWQEGIDEWRRDQGDDKWKCPTEMSDNRSEDVLVSIKSPSDKTTVTGKEVTVKVKITTINSLKNVKIFLNDKEMKNYSEDKRDIEETFKDLSDDVYKLKVRATNDKDKSGESEIKFGLNKSWDYAVLTSTPVASPSASL
ncbi:transglycosylase domain-containing protein [Candidatus Roizmanbacteria bacterium]|nr:transglycosylase domain-containing protein [Candidatus Roizmanbacteria bacterium]